MTTSDPVGDKNGAAVRVTSTFIEVKIGIAFDPPIPVEGHRAERKGALLWADFVWMASGQRWVSRNEQARAYKADGSLGGSPMSVKYDHTRFDYLAQQAPALVETLERVRRAALTAAAS